MSMIADQKKIPATRTAGAEDGFTLVELLVVLVILVLLASIVGPRVIGYLQSSKAKAAHVQIESLITSLELFHIDVGRYPSSAEGLDALVKPAGKATGWNGPYLSKGSVPLDPWGQPYKYASPGKRGTFDIFTLGGDGKEGGANEDADIYN